MTEAIYKVGDILEFTEVVPRQFGLRTGPVRGLVIKINNPGYEYLSYRLLVSEPMDGTEDMMIYCVPEKNIVSAAKRVDHIDISALMFMENDESYYEKMMTAFACVESANLRKLLAGETLKRVRAEVEREEKAKENERLSYENSDLKALNEVLKRENEEVRGYNKELEQALSKSEDKAHSRRDEIAFLMRKVNELESANNDLKAELDEKAEELKKVYSSDLACENNRLRETNEKLSAENERLSNAQRYLDLSNENRELKAEYFACTEKIKKLENENARYLQSMTCAEKQMTEAAKCIYEAREHINMAIYNN